MTTVANKFLSDGGTRTSINELMDQFDQHRRRIDAVQPPTEDPELDYDRWIERAAEGRGRPLFYPYLANGMGNGTLVELGDGSVKYDFIIGVGVHYLGHSHPELTRALLEASLGDTVMQGNLQQNTESVRLMEDFIDVANRNGAGLDHCFLTSSGAMANENALKILFHHRDHAERVLTFDGAFAGRTLALAQITDKPDYRVGLPETIEVDRVPFVPEGADSSDHDEALRKLDELLNQRSDRYAGMMMELIQGEGGFYPGDSEFLRNVMERLQEYDVPVFVDEIQSFGRTTQPFAFQKFGLDEFVDVVTVGKMTQACATLYRETLNPDPGLISQTFTASTTAIRAGRFIIEHLLNNDFFGPEGKNQQIHEWITDGLRDIQSRHPNWLSGPFGTGTMVAFQVFDGSKENTKSFLHELFDNGVIGFLAGDGPSRVRFLPPGGSVSRDEIEHALEITEEALQTVVED